MSPVGVARLFSLLNAMGVDTSKLSPEMAAAIGVLIRGLNLLEAL